MHRAVHSGFLIKFTLSFFFFFGIGIDGYEDKYLLGDAWNYDNTVGHFAEPHLYAPFEAFLVNV
jgi:hypothetical protein